MVSIEYPGSGNCSQQKKCILQHTTITCIYIVVYLTCCLPRRTDFIAVSILMGSLSCLSCSFLGITGCDWLKPSYRIDFGDWKEYPGLVIGLV